METSCSLCNAPMSCEPKHGCWCAAFPHVLPIPQGTTGCLCPRCLAKQVDLHIASSSIESNSQ